jgi:hypothetical protein
VRDYSPNWNCFLPSE